MRKLAGYGPEEDTQCDVDVLQIFATSDDWYIPWLRATVKYNWFLYPRDEKMSPFPYHNVLYATELVKDDSSVSSIHIIQSEFTTPPTTANARPNFPMDSNTLAAMTPSVASTHTCFHSDLHMNSPVCVISILRGEVARVKGEYEGMRR